MSAEQPGEPAQASEPSWWRRNRWPVLALAVLLPGTLILTTSSEWFDYQNGLYSRPIEVAGGDSVVYGGVEFRVDDTVLVRVKRLGDGNVCHTGNRTCFFKDIDG